MSLVHLSNLCAHLKNCSLVNISKTSIPFSRMHLQVALGLYKEGFLSSVQKGSTSGPDKVPVEVTPDNIATRRLWVDLKYRNNLPVIREISMILKPGRKVNMTVTEIKALASGLAVRFVLPLQPAEILFVRTLPTEIIEVQEAAKRGLAGMALCRVK